MVKSYSLDLRERVVASVLAGATVRAVAAQFSISVASVVRWSQRWRATGSAEVSKIAGRRESILASERPYLLERIAGESDVTIRQLQAELAQRGVIVCYGTVWKFIHDERLSFKKNYSAK